MSPPTLLEAAGLEPGAELQGRSLVPVLENDARAWRTSFLIEHFSDTVYPRIRNMGYVAVRTSRHKSASSIASSRGWTNSTTSTTIREETNLVDRPDARETLQKMQAELQR